MPFYVRLGVKLIPMGVIRILVTGAKGRAIGGPVVPQP